MCLVVVSHFGSMMIRGIGGSGRLISSVWIFSFHGSVVFRGTLAVHFPTPFFQACMPAVNPFLGHGSSRIQFTVSQFQIST